MTERDTNQSTIKSIRDRAFNKTEIGRSLFIGCFMGGFIFLVNSFLLGSSNVRGPIVFGLGGVIGTHAYRVFSPEVSRVRKAVAEKIHKKK